MKSTHSLSLFSLSLSLLSLSFFSLSLSQTPTPWSSQGSAVSGDFRGCECPTATAQLHGSAWGATVGP